jgi:hypothetical protein
MTRLLVFCLAGITTVLLAGSARAALDAAIDGPSPTSPLGASCRRDADCGDPELTCLLASSTALGGRGPAGGLCTRTCASDDDCTKWDASATCQSDSPDPTQLYCFEGCSHDDQYRSPRPSASKCHGRTDMACAGGELGFAATLCVPACTTDAQCGSGLRCNPHWGLCQADAPQGDPVGTACDPRTRPTTCDGFCLGSSSGVGICTQVCPLGAPGVCGHDDGGTRREACLAQLPPNGGTSVGDLGACSKLCNCDADCALAGLVCEPTALAGGTGFRGTCVAADLTTVSIPVCSEPDDLGACVYGRVRSCEGDGGCLGVAECLADRTGYGPCRCSDRSATSDAGPDAAADASRDASVPSSRDSGPTERADSAALPHDAGSLPPVSGRTPAAECACRLGRAEPSRGAALLALCVGLTGLRRRGARSRRAGRAERTEIRP